ncbi:hypothetical protein P152DRAFT_258594 [Eremomyces bilateralis CBS 781.70]|uniref:Uncharacterized protein n=1 Tax=Eremomyces bilateralis CBS 781.70 TaxID=1392243 RepID=A0A6G1FQL0_9PEZI|nr:uncharacterized protein P152DRAFT_258594 [Eremomyces bilateralis CBS 781.70]KAF1808018.1 hypothetical protein P152DRAFT_258594 [Eremomyces bilateralis CBS 781.70]
MPHRVAAAALDVCGRAFFGAVGGTVTFLIAIAADVWVDARLLAVWSRLVRVCFRMVEAGTNLVHGDPPPRRYSKIPWPAGVRAPPAPSCSTSPGGRVLLRVSRWLLGERAMPYLRNCGTWSRRDRPQIRSSGAARGSPRGSLARPSSTSVGRSRRCAGT